MTRTLKVATVSLLLLAASLAWSQPRGGQGMAGGRMGGGTGMSAEQILGFLALDPDIDLTDTQLVELRASLRRIYQGQLELRENLRSGAVDFQGLREEIVTLRTELMDQVKGVLTEEQQQKLGAAQEAMQSRASRGRRPGSWN